jgi:hypothetical protein
LKRFEQPDVGFEQRDQGRDRVLVGEPDELAGRRRSRQAERSPPRTALALQLVAEIVQRCREVVGQPPETGVCSAIGVAVTAALLASIVTRSPVVVRSVVHGASLAAHGEKDGCSGRARDYSPTPELGRPKPF